MGERSVLRATNPKNGAIILTGTGSRLARIKMLSSPTERSGTIQSAAVTVDHANAFTVQYTTVVGSSSVGILVSGSSCGYVSHNTVAGSNADGISVINDQPGQGSRGDGAQSRDVIVSDNLVERSSDDSISVVSYMVNGSTGSNGIFSL